MRWKIGWFSGIVFDCRRAWGGTLSLYVKFRVISGQCFSALFHDGLSLAPTVLALVFLVVDPRKL
jgi:hypothetical protein